MTQSIREEFDKAYEFDKPGPTAERKVALWAARWMAERCAKECDSIVAVSGPLAYGMEIRQLAKELK